MILKPLAIVKIYLGSLQQTTKRLGDISSACEMKHADAANYHLSSPVCLKVIRTVILIF